MIGRTMLIKAQAPVENTVFAKDQNIGHLSSPWDLLAPGRLRKLVFEVAKSVASM